MSLVGCDWNKGDWLLRVLQLRLMINELLVKLFERGWNVLSSNLISDDLVILMKTFKKLFDLILNVDGFIQSGELIVSRRKALIVLVNRLSTLDPVFDLLSQMIDMASGRFRIGRRKRSPDLGGCVGCGEQRLQRGGNGAKECAVYETILSLPECIKRICGGFSISSDCRRGYLDRAIKIACEIIAFEKSVDLTR